VRETWGGFGGGGNGAGRVVGSGGDLIIMLRGSSAKPVCRSSSWAVGTSERNSRSSAERAIESLEVDLPVRPENRPRKRDTAEGGGVASRTIVSVVSVADGLTGSAFKSTFSLIEADPKDVAMGEDGAVRPTAGVCTVLERLPSTLGRGDAVLIEGARDVLAGEAGRFALRSIEDVVPFLPKKENRPPLFFFESSTADESSFTFSTIFQPVGVTSSCATVGLDLIDASQEVEPFEDMYIAMGLIRVSGACLDNFKASESCFDVNVLENAVFMGKTKSSGISLCIIESLRID